MDWNTLRDLYTDIFTDPKVGWYDKAKNLKGLEIARERGIPFVNHLVERYNPYEVVDMYEKPYPSQYQKVNIPPRSQLTESGRRYRVAPKNIIPYSPNNKSLARVLLNKGINYGGKALGKIAVPLAILEGLGFNQAVK